MTIETEPLLISKETMCELLGISIPTFHRKFFHVADFPKPVIRNGNKHLWRLADVQAWVKNLKPEE